MVLFFYFFAEKKKVENCYEKFLKVFNSMSMAMEERKAKQLVMVKAGTISLQKGKKVKKGVMGHARRMATKT